MKCNVNYNSSNYVLISEISFQSYKEICSGEKTKVNLGYLGYNYLEVENNSMVHTPRKLENYIYGIYSNMPLNWEVLFKFFSLHNIEPNWLHCNYNSGHYNESLGAWTGCMGKV